MRGRPLFECFVFLFLWTLLCFPLSRWTRSRPDSVSSAKPGVSEDGRETRRLWGMLKAAPRPISFCLEQNGRILWESSETGPEFPLEKELAVHVEAERSEITARAEFEGETDCYLELTLVPRGEAERSSGLWGRQTVEGIFEFEWKRRTDAPNE
jgi:hypothetical protein